MSKDGDEIAITNVGCAMIVLAVMVLTALCAGEPDLLDAITAWVNRQP